MYAVIQFKETNRGAGYKQCSAHEEKGAKTSRSWGFVTAKLYDCTVTKQITLVSCEAWACHTNISFFVQRGVHA